MASSANFGKYEFGKDSKANILVHEDEKPMNITNDLALGGSEKTTEHTKKCNYIDQYFSYKNHQKKEVSQSSTPGA